MDAKDVDTTTPAAIVRLALEDATAAQFHLDQGDAEAAGRWLDRVAERLDELDDALGEGS